jgi:hypothetical protein
VDLTTRTLLGLGGIARRSELEAAGVDPGEIDIAARYGRRLIRVRKGWYALWSEDAQVVRAWRVGGRLTCVSALAYHLNDPPPPVLHVEVPATASRLRDPDRFRARLSASTAVVVHWVRPSAEGDRRAVGPKAALASAERCGVQSGPSRRQAAVTSSASRIV